MPLTDGPCEPWPYLFPCDPDDAPDLDQWDDATIELVTMAATEQLWAASGRRYGTCQRTIRPCARSCVESFPAMTGVGTPPYIPVNLGNATWVNLSCGCGSPCSCGTVERVDLAALGPIAGVTEVLIDGQSIAVSGAGRTVRVDDARYVTRVDGGSWPLCNDLAVDPPAVGAWSLTVAVGLDVPYTGRLAMGEVIQEVLKACAGDACKLPAGAVLVTKRGVTIELDPSRLTPFAEAFVRAVNPGGLREASRVYSPDLHRPTQTTWP